jgi:hypothetical protein
LVAVCEPLNELSDEEIGALKHGIEERINKIPQKFRPQVLINEGRFAEDTIYSRHPEETVARVPRNLSWAVRDQKERLRGEAVRLRVGAGVVSAIPIFLSRRFSESTQGSRKLEDVRQALRDSDCLPVEAESVVAREPITIYTDVSSKMWASKGGVFLVTKEPDTRHISINLAHELGFLLGQGKRVLMIVEDEPSCIDVMHSFANIAGVLFERFDPNVAHNNLKSIHSIVSNWTKQLRDELEQP